MILKQFPRDHFPRDKHFTKGLTKGRFVTKGITKGILDKGVIKGEFLQREVSRGDFYKGINTTKFHNGINKGESLHKGIRKGKLSQRISLLNFILLFHFAVKIIIQDVKMARESREGGPRPSYRAPSTDALSATRPVRRATKPALEVPSTWASSLDRCSWGAHSQWIALWTMSTLAGIRVLSGRFSCSRQDRLG